MPDYECAKLQIYSDKKAQLIKTDLIKSVTSEGKIPNRRIRKVRIIIKKGSSLPGPAISRSGAFRRYAFNGILK
jgi:hypothetical protein